MKNILFAIAVLLSVYANSQVLGADMLNLDPKTTTERDAITIAQGLIDGSIVLNTTTGTLQRYNGSTWVDLGGSGGSDDDITAVSFDGTNLTVTEGATSFSADISGVDTQLTQSQVGTFAAAEGFITTYTETDPTVNQALIEGFGFVTGAHTANTDDQTATEVTNTAVNGNTNVQAVLDDHETRIDALVGGGSDGAITDLTLNGTTLEVTGTGTAENVDVDLSSLQDGFEANTDTQNLSNVLGQGNTTGVNDIDFVSQGSLLDALNVTSTQGTIGTLGGTSLTYSSATLSSLQVNGNILIGGDNHLRFNANDSAQTDVEGVLYADDSENRLKYNDGTSSRALAFQDEIGGGGATLTQEEVEDYVGGMVVATSDGLNYTDVSGALTVDNSELDASVIPNVPTGNLAATNIQGALNELQSEVDAFTVSSNSDVLTFSDEADGYTFLATDFDSGRKMFENFSATDEEYVLDDVAAVGEKIVISQKGTGKIQVAEGTASLPLGEFQTKDNQTHLTLYKASDNNYYVIGDWDAYTSTPAGNPNQFTTSNASNPDNEANNSNGYTTNDAIITIATSATSSNGVNSVSMTQTGVGTGGDAQINSETISLPAGNYTYSVDYNAPIVGTDMRFQLYNLTTLAPINTQDVNGTGAFVTVTHSFTLGSTADVLLIIRTSQNADNYTANGNADFTMLIDNLILTED